MAAHTTGTALGVTVGASGKYGGLMAALVEAVPRVAAAHPMAVPTHLMPPGTTLLRAVPAQYAPLLKTPAGATVGFIGAEQERQARTPRDELGKSTNNRWTGWGPGGRVAGLYLSVSSNALGAELAHYQKGRVADAFTAARPTLTLMSFRVLRSFVLADFSKHNAHAAKVFDLLAADPAVQSALWAAGLRGRPLADLAFDAADYSCARGIGIGLSLLTRPSLDGLLVRSARGDVKTRYDGDNVVLFGQANVPHDALALEAIIELAPGGSVDRIRRTTVKP